MTNSKPILTITNNMATCEYNCDFAHREIDHQALKDIGNCEVCKAEVTSGWYNLDGGEIYCDDCVIDIRDAGKYIAELEGQIKTLELSENVLIQQRNAANRAILKLHCATVAYLAEWETSYGS